MTTEFNSALMYQF